MSILGDAHVHKGAVCGGPARTTSFPRGRRSRALAGRVEHPLEGGGETRTRGVPTLLPRDRVRFCA